MRIRYVTLFAALTLLLAPAPTAAQFCIGSDFALDVGFKKVMLDQAKSLIGLGLSFQR